MRKQRGAVSRRQETPHQLRQALPGSCRQGPVPAAAGRAPAPRRGGPATSCGLSFPRNLSSAGGGPVLPGCSSSSRCRSSTRLPRHRVMTTEDKLLLDIRGQMGLGASESGDVPGPAVRDTWWPQHRRRGHLPCRARREENTMCSVLPLTHRVSKNSPLPLKKETESKLAAARSSGAKNKSA